jgi:hypothetical protein
VQTLKIIDTNTAGIGNDFTLDDLSFQAVPEPSSLFLLGSGVVGVTLVTVARRWKRQTAV